MTRVRTRFKGNDINTTRKEDLTVTELKKRRKALGVSQMDLARLVGVSLLTIQTWERGAGEPKPENREKLEQILSSLEKGANICE